VCVSVCVLFVWEMCALRCVLKCGVSVRDDDDIDMYVGVCKKFIVYILYVQYY
jgi:hypothetical protein